MPSMYRLMQHNQRFGIIFFIMREYMTFADERIHSVKNQRATHMAVSEERENFSNAILHLEQDCLYR